MVGSSPLSILGYFEGKKWVVLEDASFSLLRLKSHFISSLLFWAESFDVGEDSFANGLMNIPRFFVWLLLGGKSLFFTGQTCLCILGSSLAPQFLWLIILCIRQKEEKKKIP